MKKNQAMYFPVYLDTKRHVERLSLEERGRLFTALYEFAVSGEYDEPENPATDMALSFMTAQMERDFDKLDKTREINTENGKKGGAPKNNQNAKKQPKTTETTKEKEEEKEKENNKEEYKYDNKDNNKKENKEKNTPPEGDASERELKEIVDSFNSICYSLPKVTKLTESRRCAVRSAKALLGDKDFAQLFGYVQRSDFLTGRKGGWRASFDWIMQPEHVIKILEKNYDDSGPKGFGSRGGFAARKNPYCLLDDIPAIADPPEL